MLLELEELKRDEANFKQQIEAAEKTIKSYQEEVNAMEAEASKSKVKVNTESHYQFSSYWRYDPLKLKLYDVFFLLFGFSCHHPFMFSLGSYFFGCIATC